MSHIAGYARFHVEPRHAGWHSASMAIETSVLIELERLCRAASPGPWQHFTEHGETGGAGRSLGHRRVGRDHARR